MEFLCVLVVNVSIGLFGRSGWLCGGRWGCRWFSGRRWRGRNGGGDGGSGGDGRDGSGGLLVLSAAGSGDERKEKNDHQNKAAKRTAFL